MSKQIEFSMDDILSILPHRPPFLFVDRVVRLKPFKRIITERELRNDEPHFAGHFPGQPVMPGVLITDALAQTSGLLIGLSKKTTESESQDGIFFLGSANMKYPAPAVPGDLLRMTAFAEGTSGKLSRFIVEACVGRKLVAQGTLTLAMIENDK
ncbi:3-hydroxyacyl-ACP dehydratase FabZ [PVC group bacterium]|nr:3-hydroxyacyl-ACP dehydratase FabZ [PVC group bacterium]